jgi:4-hydroxybenzoate polyprenyltransferase and related prenyltransferases
MIKRLSIYFKEMYPLFPRLLVGFLLFFEIYFLVILTSNYPSFNIGIQEIIGSITIFLFLMFLRIADDFKDKEADRVLFPDRAFPSGKVKENDLVIAFVTIIVVTIVLNVFFMNNLLYFAILASYGALMSVWFFKKNVIQKSLPLALITHNPVQLFLNLYIVSFTCLKYGIPIFSVTNIIILFTLYWPGLIWEVSRKIRAPKDETEYTTYSKLFGYKKATNFILLVMFFDMLTSAFLVYKLLPYAVITVIISYLWLIFKCRQFIDNPERFKLVSKIELYEYITEGTMVLIEIIFILGRVL